MLTSDKKKHFKAILDTVEEVITSEDLSNYLESDMLLKHYLGFEISGQVHIGEGICLMLTIKALQDAGVITTIFLADWHSYINRKLGGNLKVIREIALTYFKEAIIAGALCVGADPNKIRFVLASDVYNNDYWETVLEVASHMTLSRTKRSITIAGREEGEDIALSFMLYPAMQVADIFHMGINIAHSAIDQRKAHVIARSVATKLTHSPLVDEKGNIIKPVALHNRLILGLSKPSLWPVPKEMEEEFFISTKMSKSKPETAIFIHDEPDIIEYKIKKAFCPPKETALNPIIQWVIYIILPLKGSITLERPQKFGGVLTLNSREELIKKYENEEIHPEDLKNAVSKSLIALLEPARKHFEHPDRKKALQMLNELQITR